MLSIGFALYADTCPNTYPAYDNDESTCTDCATGHQSNPGTPCTYNQSSALTLCDCNTNTKCTAGNNTVNVTITPWGGKDAKCSGGKCAQAIEQAGSTGTGKINEQSPCSA